MDRRQLAIYAGVAVGAAALTTVGLMALGLRGYLRFLEPAAPSSPSSPPTAPSNNGGTA